MRSHPAFTIIELLSVVGIVGLLASLGFVGYSALVAYAHEAKCASNLRQIGQAMQLYAQDHGGRLPRTSHGSTFSSSGAEQSWIFSLAPYLEDVDEIRVCPADPRADEIVENNGTSYVLNEFVFVPRIDYAANPATGELEFIVEDYSLLVNMAAPSETFLAFPRADNYGGGADSAVSRSQDHAHSRSWFSWGAVLRDIQPDRHGDDANYLFADGHVENIPQDVLRARIESGDNFAQPTMRQP
ncbi:MAG: prepilin-type N-terminal cleavage/methylation domain-containing protein [Opitutales bacterium]